MPSLRIVKPADYLTQRWKNGRGHTSQLAIHPAGADFSVDRFGWRISSARVASNGAFSRFAGYDRILHVIGGSSLKLAISSANSSPTEIELELFKSCRFAGEDDVTAQVEPAEIVDYNLFWDRQTFNASSKIIFEPVSIEVPNDTHVFVTAIKDVSLTVVDQNIELEDWNSLIIEPSVRTNFKLAIALKSTEGSAILNLLQRK